MLPYILIWVGGGFMIGGVIGGIIGYIILTLLVSKGV